MSSFFKLDGPTRFNNEEVENARNENLCARRFRGLTELSLNYGLIRAETRAYAFLLYTWDRIGLLQKTRELLSLPDYQGAVAE